MGSARQAQRYERCIRVPDQKNAAVEHLQLLVQDAGPQIWRIWHATRYLCT